VTRRPTGPQAAAILASLSINAALFLGLRQIGTLSSDAAADDVAPLLVLELDAPDPHRRSREDRRAKERSKAGRTSTAPERRRPAPMLAEALQARVAPAPASPLLQVADDRWQAPARSAGRKTFATTFQRSLAEPVPSVERPSVLAGVAFRDGSFAGFLARLGKMADCGELHAAMAHHPESAATIAQTMERLGCRE
jgi:hypothetical protein